MSPRQHIIPNSIILAVGCWVAWVSFTQTPAESFLFPRIISVAFVGFAAWTFARSMMRISRVGEGVTSYMLVDIAPGLIVALIYIFWAAQALGFYTATTIAFFALLAIYDPASHGELKTWVKRAAITACYMVVMYGVFAKLLKVFTPREILF